MKVAKKSMLSKFKQLLSEFEAKLVSYLKRICFMCLGKVSCDFIVKCLITRRVLGAAWAVWPEGHADLLVLSCSFIHSTEEMGKMWRMGETQNVFPSSPSWLVGAPRACPVLSGPALLLVPRLSSILFPLQFLSCFLINVLHWTSLLGKTPRQVPCERGRRREVEWMSVFVF